MTTDLGTAGPSAALARFAAGLDYDDIPDAAIDRIKLCLLDTVGCGVFATTLPWGRILGRYVADMGGAEDAVMWGARKRVPAANAALVNGTLVHGFEIDDLHKPAILHPSSAAIPAALAVAEAAGAVSGRELVAALVAGFEAGIRAGLSVGVDHLVRGFHPTGTSGTVAAAAAAGRAMRLSHEAMEHAISIGATQAAGLVAAQFESMVKRMHAGRAAQAGVYGAELARRGFTGIDGVFEAEYGGYCSTLSDTPNPAALTDALGERFETENVGFKIYSCCGSCHTSVEAIRRLLRKRALPPEEIERIEVDATKATLLHVGWPYEPRSITAAQLNLPYCVAVTVFDGNAFVEQFSEQRIRDPQVIALARRVEVRNEPAFDAMGPTARHRIRLRVVLRGGETLEEAVDHAKGSEADPLSPAEVVEKYRRLVEPIAGNRWADDLHDFVMTIEDAPSVAPLSELLSQAFLDVSDA